MISAGSAPACRLANVSWANLVVLAALALVILFLVFTERNFLSAQNITNVLRGASFLMIVAAGQMLVMIVGGLDLSIGACMALSSVISATVMVNVVAVHPDSQAFAFLAGVASALLCGVVLGLVNGVCVAVLQIPSLIVTLGVSSVASGLALLLTSGLPIYGLPAHVVEDIGRTSYLGLPCAVWVAFALVAGLVVLQRFTHHGARLLATGGNEHAAIVSGISTRGYLLAAYVCSSVFASFAALLLTAQIGSGQSSIGDRLTLESIAAAVIGGVSIRGGSGKPERVAAAALFLLVLNNVMDLLRIDSKSQMIWLGAFVLIAAGAGVINGRRRHA
jgi:ribose transport system permease protein